jgi:hypothetical protein
MSVSWITPAALIGLALVTLPIMVHLAGAAPRARARVSIAAIPS